MENTKNFKNSIIDLKEKCTLILKFATHKHCEVQKSNHNSNKTIFIEKDNPISKNTAEESFKLAKTIADFYEDIKKSNKKEKSESVLVNTEQQETVNLSTSKDKQSVSIMSTKETVSLKDNNKEETITYYKNPISNIKRVSQLVSDYYNLQSFLKTIFTQKRQSKLINNKYIENRHIINFFVKLTTNSKNLYDKLTRNCKIPTEYYSNPITIEQLTSLTVINDSPLIYIFYIIAFIPSTFIDNFFQSFQSNKTSYDNILKKTIKSSYIQAIYSSINFNKILNIFQKIKDHHPEFQNISISERNLRFLMLKSLAVAYINCRVIAPSTGLFYTLHPGNYNQYVTLTFFKLLVKTSSKKIDFRLIGKFSRTILFSSIEEKQIFFDLFSEFEDCFSEAFFKASNTIRTKNLVNTLSEIDSPKIFGVEKYKNTFYKKINKIQVSKIFHLLTLKSISNPMREFSVSEISNIKNQFVLRVQSDVDAIFYKQIIIKENKPFFVDVYIIWDVDLNFDGNTNLVHFNFFYEPSVGILPSFPKLNSSYFFPLGTDVEVGNIVLTSSNELVRHNLLAEGISYFIFCKLQSSLGLKPIRVSAFSLFKLFRSYSPYTISFIGEKNRKLLCLTNFKESTLEIKRDLLSLCEQMYVLLLNDYDRQRFIITKTSVHIFINFIKQPFFVINTKNLHNDFTFLTTLDSKKIKVEADIKLISLLNDCVFFFYFTTFVRGFENKPFRLFNVIDIRGRLYNKSPIGFTYNRFIRVLFRFDHEDGFEGVSDIQVLLYITNLLFKKSVLSGMSQNKRIFFLLTHVNPKLKYITPEIIISFIIDKFVGDTLFDLKNPYDHILDAFFQHSTSTSEESHCLFILAFQNRVPTVIQGSISKDYELYSEHWTLAVIVIQRFLIQYYQGKASSNYSMSVNMLEQISKQHYFLFKSESIFKYSLEKGNTPEERVPVSFDVKASSITILGLLSGDKNLLQDTGLLRTFWITTEYLPGARKYDSPFFKDATHYPFKEKLYCISTEDKAKDNFIDTILSEKYKRRQYFYIYKNQTNFQIYKQIHDCYDSASKGARRYSCDQGELQPIVDFYTTVLFLIIEHKSRDFAPQLCTRDVCKKIIIFWLTRIIAPKAVFSLRNEYKELFTEHNISYEETKEFVSLGFDVLDKYYSRASNFLDNLIEIIIENIEEKGFFELFGNARTLTFVSKYSEKSSGSSKKKIIVKDEEKGTSSTHTFSKTDYIVLDDGKHFTRSKMRIKISSHIFAFLEAEVMQDTLLQCIGQGICITIIHDSIITESQDVRKVKQIHGKGIIRLYRSEMIKRSFTAKEWARLYPTNVQLKRGQKKVIEYSLVFGHFHFHLFYIIFLSKEYSSMVEQ